MYSCRQSKSTDFSTKCDGHWSCSESIELIERMSYKYFKIFLSSGSLTNWEIVHVIPKIFRVSQKKLVNHQKIGKCSILQAESESE